MKLSAKASDAFDFKDGDKTSEAKREQAYKDARYVDLQLHQVEERTTDHDSLLRQQFKAQQTGYNAQFPNQENHAIVIDNKVVGSLVLEARARGVLIVDFFLIPDCRGKGIAAHVIRRTQESCAAINRHLLARVMKSNNQAMAFYSHCGFVPVLQDDLSILFEWFPPH